MLMVASLVNALIAEFMTVCRMLLLANMVSNEMKMDAKLVNAVSTNGSNRPHTINSWPTLMGFVFILY